MEDELADAIAIRTGATAGDLVPVVLAAAVNAATEHAVGQWLEAGGSAPIHTYVHNALRELESMLLIERPA